MWDKYSKWVHTAPFVSVEDGAGAVHIVPSFGEEDFVLGQEIGLGLFEWKVMYLTIL